MPFSIRRRSRWMPLLAGIGLLAGLRPFGARAADTSGDASAILGILSYLPAEADAGTISMLESVQTDTLAAPTRITGSEATATGATTNQTVLTSIGSVATTVGDASVVASATPEVATQGAAASTSAVTASTLVATPNAASVTPAVLTVSASPSPTSNPAPLPELASTPLGMAAAFCGIAGLAFRRRRAA
jgi:hypothetical protein